MKNIIFFFSLIILINACSSRSFFIKNEKNSFEQLNSQLRDRKGEILLTDDRSFVGQRIVVTENLTTWLDAKLKTPRSIPTSQIDMISIKTQKGHGIAGMIFGALAGGVAGYIILEETAEDDCRHTSKVHLCVGNELGDLLAVILGGGIGYTVGNSFGSTEKYVVIQRSTDHSSTNVEH